MPLVVGEALSVVWQEPPVSIECTASCGTRSSALDHLPESVAGAAVFDPISRSGSADCPLTSNSECLAWVRQLVCPLTSNSDVIRWSIP